MLWIRLLPFITTKRLPGTNCGWLLRFFCLLYCTPVYYRLQVHLILYPTLTSHDLWSNIPLNILTSDILVPVYGAYENLLVSSVGLKRFNLIGPSSSRMAGMSSLGCVITSKWVSG